MSGDMKSVPDLKISAEKKYMIPHTIIRHHTEQKNRRPRVYTTHNLSAKDTASLHA